MAVTDLDPAAKIDKVEVTLIPGGPFYTVTARGRVYVGIVPHPFAAQAQGDATKPTDLDNTADAVIIAFNDEATPPGP